MKTVLVHHPAYPSTMVRHLADCTCSLRQGTNQMPEDMAEVYWQVGYYIANGPCVREARRKENEGQ
jgi:hypothetical protein